MPGESTTGSLSGALPSIIAKARIIKEFEGVWRRTCDVQPLKDGTGLSWQEYALNQISGSDITETTRNENFQTLSGSLLTATPTMSQIAIKVTDRTYRRIATQVGGQIGRLTGNAMARKEDEDYLDLFSTFATGASPGTGNPLSFGHVSAAKNRITSNVTEPSMAEVYTVLHGFQIKDIQDEILAGVGTYTVPVGLTEDTFRKGFSGTVAGSNVFEDGNITVDSVPDANGATHSREGVVAVRGLELKHEERRDPSFGGGADEVFLTSEYVFVERQSGTTQVWAWLHKSDATAPTS